MAPDRTRRSPCAHRMRGPEGIPVGALRRIIISNLIVHDADPRYPSIITGIPGHDVVHAVAIYEVVDGLIAKAWFLK